MPSERAGARRKVDLMATDLTHEPSLDDQPLKGAAVPEPTRLRLRFPLGVDPPLWPDDSVYVDARFDNGVSTMFGALPPINGVTWYRDSIAGNKAGYVASVYDRDRKSVV